MAGGVVLVAAAVALGAWAVDAAADTTRVYVLSKDVAPGADLTADGTDLETTFLNLTTTARGGIFV